MLELIIQDFTNNKKIMGIMQAATRESSRSPPAFVHNGVTDTILRSIPMFGSSRACTFCSEEIKKDILMEQGTVFVIQDLFPVTQGHLLIIPFRHTLDYFTMTDEERLDAQQVLIALKDKITNYDSTVVGFNIGVNCGEAAGQTVLHAHIHLIPRREGIALFSKHFDYLR